MGHPLPRPTGPLHPYQEMKMSEKASTAMKSAKTIQYIIHRTWGKLGGGGVVRGGGQRLVPEPAEPTPLSWADPALGCQRACPAAFPWHLDGPREMPLRNCHSFLSQPQRASPTSFYTGTSIAPFHPHSLCSGSVSHVCPWRRGRPVQTLPTPPSPTIHPPAPPLSRLSSHPS